MDAATLLEAAPDSPGAEEWILKHKKEFIKRYGANGLRILYSKAWLLYGKQAKNANTAAGAKALKEAASIVLMGIDDDDEKNIVQHNMMSGAHVQFTNDNGDVQTTPFPQTTIELAYEEEVNDVLTNLKLN